MQEEKKGGTKKNEMGGKRTHRKCEDCKIITKGIWKHKSFQYCYKCYKSKMKPKNKLDWVYHKPKNQVNSPQENATGRVNGEIPAPAGTLSDKIERIWMQILNVKKGKGDKLAFEGCSKQNIKDFIQKLKEVIESSRIKDTMTCDGLKIMSSLHKLAGKELI